MYVFFHLFLLLRHFFENTISAFDSNGSSFLDVNIKLRNLFLPRFEVDRCNYHPLTEAVYCRLYGVITLRTLFRNQLIHYIREKYSFCKIMAYNMISRCKIYSSDF